MRGISTHDLALHIRALSAERGLSRAELGAITGLSPRTLQARIYGRRRWVATEILQLARHLELTVADLIPPEDSP